MNATKTLGFFASVLTALACLVPSSARAAGGDIRSIDVVKDPVRDYRANPLVAGEKITITVRLMNRDWPSVYTNSAHVNPWKLRYTGLSSEALAQYNARPKLGLWVSGGLRYAELKSNSPYVCTDFSGQTDDGVNQGRYYTALDFEYTVQAGDFAMPIQLANTAGNGPAKGGNSGTTDSNYFVMNMYDGTTPEPWTLCTFDDASVTCQFYYGPQPYTDDYGYGPPEWHDADMTKERYDLDLSGADICVQAVDLDASNYDEMDPADPIWRGIQQGTSSASPTLPTISVPGGAPDTMRAYFWTDDESVALPLDNVNTYTFAAYDEETGNATGATVTRKVGYVDIKPGAETQTFRIRAVGTVDQTAHVFMSFVPTNTFNFSNKLLENFVVRKVKVITPPPPSITVTATPTALTTSTDVEIPAAALNVELSEVYSTTEILRVKLNVAMKSGAANPFDYIGIDDNAEGDYTAQLVEVEIPAGATQPVTPYYIYANRADDDTAGAGKGIKITPSVESPAAQAFFTGRMNAATITIGGCAPVIVSPTNADTITGVPGNANYTYNIQIKDAAGELTRPYSVYWYNNGSGTPTVYTNIMAKTVNGQPNVLQVTHKYKTSGTYTPKIQIFNTDGHSVEGRFTVVVDAQKTVTAVATADTVEEGNGVDVTFTFTPGTFEEDEDGFVFLVPADEASSNLVSSTAFTKGVRIRVGDNETTQKARLDILDGWNGLTLRYDIVVRTKQTLDEGEEIPTWIQKRTLEIDASNVKPSVTKVYMSSWPHTVNNGVIGTTAAVDVPKRFKAETDEPSDIDLSNTNKQFLTEWTFFDGASATSTNVYGSPFSQEVTYTFVNSGTNSVQVRMRDKDMTDTEWGKAQIFTFYVRTIDTPAIELTPFGGSTLFTESQTGATKGRINVHLTEAPSKPLGVKLEVTRVGAAADNYPLPVLSTEYVEFKKGQTDGYFYLSDIDGTKFTESKGFKIFASVTNEEVQVESGKRWCDLYLQDTLEIQIQNEDPRIAGIATTNETLVAANVPFTISWACTDIDADLTNSFRAVWTTSEGGSYTFNGAAGVQGIFTNTFTSAGHKTVSLTVYDKDGGQDSRIYYYYISPSKGVYIYPLGPNRSGGQSGLAQDYYAQPGRGYGRVFTDGSLSKVVGFRHLWNFAPEASEAHAWAWGYKTSADGTPVKDNGAISTRDVALNPSGDSFPNNTPPAPTSDAFYTYTSDKDSFFYAWLVSSSEAGSQGASEVQLVVKPDDGSGAYDAEQSVVLAQYEEDAVSYMSVIMEAVFSREQYPEDNLGDINLDGVPDVDATKKWKGGKLYELVGGGSAGGAGTSGSGDAAGATATDLADVSGYNGTDESSGDFWPELVHTGGSMSYASGRPFTAIDERRGVHRGLNRRSADGEMISAPSLSDDEADALARAYAEAKAKGWTTLPDAAAWMKAGRWSPENPTDPTIPDTDADGLPDGVEYWIWYQATINGKMGSRFSLATIGQGETIPSEVVAYAFNPNRKRSVSGMETAYYDQNESVKILDVNGNAWKFDAADFDNDGLLDVEEVVIGTDPTNWDTDGDGILDFWEVLHGLDPLDPIDGAMGLAANDTRNNPDRDFMARKDGPKVTVVSVVKDGATSCWAFESDPVLSASDEKESVYIAASGDLFYAFAEAPVTAETSKGTVLAMATVARKVVLNGDEKLLGEKTAVATGTPLADIATDAEEIALAVLDAEKGLKVFPYGPTALGLYVPVQQDGAGEDDIPEGAVGEVVKGRQLIYIHNQVFRQEGFDPRTGWNDDGAGFVAGRWNASVEGKSGAAVNTVPYTSLDEFLVLRYRYDVKASSDKDVFFAGRDLEADLPLWPKKAVQLFWGGLQSNRDQGATTVPVAELLKTNAVTSVTRSVYGADTDGDGVPDGWELYVDYDPNDGENKRPVGGSEGARSDDPDGDTLKLAAEYAGTDSCNAYTNVLAVYANHPGIKSGWYNKFFPTNPYSADTDGDGLSDNLEGAANGVGEFWVGRTRYDLSKGLVHTFIYGEITDDGKTCCFPGGGLNPCTVDTDQDLLPDLWEYEFSGVVVSKDATGISGVSDSDFKQIMTPDGLWAPHGDVFIVGGMDGTWPGDASCDFDHDGLLNYQEYLVQALRHLRYDDSETPLMGRELVDGELSPFIQFLPMQTWDAEDFYKRCREAGFSGGSAFNYVDLGYFTRPPQAWDRLALNRSANAMACVAYGDPMNADDPRNGFRIMLRPNGIGADGERYGRSFGGYLATDVRAYASTDPRRWDSDDDGMDDYYEIFHGLNPLLGSAADPRTTDVASQAQWAKYDRIAMIYGGTITAWNNAWTKWNENAFLAAWGEPIPMFDAMKYPWMMGTAEADADGDGLRNADEALMVNQQAPAASHTDPTPLWYTDSTITNKASFVAQYYSMDPYLMYSDKPGFPSGHLLMPWLWNMMTVKQSFIVDGRSLDWMFAFEENEGYDTDRDWIADGDEQVRSVTPASDPINAMDPDRRQAIYFPAAPFSAAVSHAAAGARAFSAESEMFKQFTVEAWVRPEVSGREQVILERVANYGPSTLSNNVQALRANFRIGLAADGSVYGMFEGTTADSPSQYLKGPVLPLDAWSHIAFSFDGSDARLYLNDAAGPVATARGVTLVPANGVMTYDQDPLDLYRTLLSTNSFMGYTTVPCAFVLGARAVTPSVIALSAKTTVDDFADCFQGYVDEVRVWDGARTSGQLAADYAVRYTWEDVLANRQEVFAAWKDGARRNTAQGAGNLPAELVQHYSFQTLPGAVDPQQVMTEPRGFSQKVIDNVRIDDDYVPGGLFPGWWAALPDSVANTVYWNRSYIPWINNTVRHLPSLEGTTADSWYWTHASAGVLTTNDAGVLEFAFSDSANPYGAISYSYERYVHMFRIYAGTTGGVTRPELHDELLKRWAFDQRAGFVATDDLVPLGGAFAKRVAEYWDGQGASDAWLYTGVDNDVDGLPDWWEELYGDPADLTADTVITWNGLSITAREAYIRDLAAGLLPDGVKNPTYADKKDGDLDGLPDWWQDLYALEGNADDDQDGDQLSNRSEFLIGEGFLSYGFPRVNPEKQMTFEGQVVPDYFLRVGKLYLGEMFQDHDFMEDAWEKQFAPTLSTSIYDLWNDPDDDGWSNWAECRAATDPTKQATVSIDGYTLAAHPEPVIHATVVYNGEGTLNVPVVFQARRSGVSAAEIADVRWVSGGAGANTKFIGVNPRKEQTIHLGGGVVQPGSVNLEVKCPVYYNWTWDADLNYWQVTYSLMSSWHTAVADIVDLDDDSRGFLFKGGAVENRIGTIDYKTGEVVIDFSKMTGSLFTKDGDDSQTEWPLDNAYVRVSWSASFPASTQRLLIDLIDPAADTDTIKTRGYVREGLNTITAFLDRNKDGVWTPGEPYGVVKDVDVGWSETSFSIELTDTTPQMFRLKLDEALQNNDFEAQRALNDRGVNGSPYAPNKAVNNVGTNMPAATENSVRLRIVRSEINGLGTVGSANASEVVLDEEVYPQSNPVFSEANLLQSGKFDLDWGTLTTRAAEMSIGQVLSATYRVVVGNGTVSHSATNNNLATLFVNRYETERTPVVPDPQQSQIVYAAAPTFRWAHPNTIGKRYPAFGLKIYASDKKTVVYTSGVQQTPICDKDGYYEWTAPFFRGSVTKAGHVVNTTNVYYWAVSMLDAKFPTSAGDTAKLTPFRMNTTGDLTDGRGYGTINVAVKYTGALAESVVKPSASNMKNIIRVQAFTTADLSGTPAGEAYVGGTIADLLNVSNKVVNARIRGLAPGSYYVRAYLDTDGDGEWSKWESWGYGCYVGDDNAANQSVTRGGVIGAASAAAYVYTPCAYEVKEGALTPVAVVFLEDADMDGDGFPDAWEMETNGSLSSNAPITGNTFYATVNPNLASKLNAYTKLTSLTSAQTETLGIKLMGALLAGTPELSYQAAVLMGAPADVTLTEVGAKIVGFSTTDGLTVETEAVSTTGTGVQLLSAAPVTVKWTLYYAPTLDAPFEPVDLGTVTTRPAGASETVDFEAVRKAAQGSESYSDKSGFFKVGVEIVK